MFFPKFNLFCDQDIYAKAAQSVFMTGVLFGSLASGQLSDYFGRRMVLHVSLVMEAICGMVMALSWNYYIIVVFWFLIGFVDQARF